MLFDLQHIVCAVDLSPHTKGVLDGGQLLARAFDAHMSIFHAVTASHDRFPGTTIFERGGQQTDLLTAARRRLEDLAASLENTEGIVAAGDPVETLAEYLRKTSASLVVAARHGCSGIQRVLLGSVVERMARQLATPLLVVGLTKAGTWNRRTFRKVVVACDAVDATSPALTVAVAVARRFDATLHLLHAMELPLKAEMLEPTDGPYGEIQAALQDRLHQNLTALASVVAKDLSVSVDLAPGPAAEILPFYIRQQKADLLVVGVRSRRRLQQLLIGSTTEAALRHASCAVLTVPTTMTSKAVAGKKSSW